LFCEGSSSDLVKCQLFSQAALFPFLPNDYLVQAKTIKVHSAELCEYVEQFLVLYMKELQCSCIG